MNPIVAHGVGRSLRTTFQTSKTLNLTTVATGASRTQPGQRWVCLDCRASVPRAAPLSTITREGNASRIRPFTTTRTLRDERNRLNKDESTSHNPTITNPSDPIRSSSSDIPSLPSQTAQNRTQLSTRITRITDSILARASVAGQHINVYTGTDYSGIESLRQQITAQESLVRAKHSAVDEARVTHQEAHTAQASAQKEIVGLLERKSSWSPADLERYMSLVRSEHANEQAVQAANDGLAATERHLENSRGLLERLERKQYHEEQVWSDTIRRNSTWVTFGLMGVNIVLLLAQIAIFEPYRRRKIVREVERVVEEKAWLGGTDGVGKVEKQVDEVVEPAGVALEAIETPAFPANADVESTNVSRPLDSTPLPIEAIDAPQLPPPPVPLKHRQIDTWTARWESYVDSFQDLFSERLVQLKKVDVTTTALQGAATGVAAMGLLFVFFRPR